MNRTAEQVVVIGAGMGGLAAAMRLAHAGFGVTVLDRAQEPGGKMRVLPSVAGPVDAGPTVLTMRPVFEALFADVGLSLDAAVTLHRETVLARHWWPDGTTLDLFADPAASEAAVGHAFGGPSAAEFRAFCQEARALYETFDAPMIQAPAPRLLPLALAALARPTLTGALLPGATLARRLGRRFSDPRLRQLFGRYATYVGGSPYASPAVLGLIWHSEAQGVWRVVGGMHRLARAMAEAATGLGATFRYGADVSRIEMQGGQVAAVHTADGTRLKADAVVFNGDPRALAQGLLGPAMQSAVPPRATEPRSLSANVWAFAATPQGADLVHHNVFFGADPKTEFHPLEAGLRAEDPTLYVCAQDRGGDRQPAGPERFEIIMNAPPHGAGPAEDKTTCRTRTFQMLAARGLRFDPLPEIETLTLPAGFDALFPASLGSLYGRSPHGLMASFHRPPARTRVPGLYLAGGGAHPGAGIPMATLSGRHAAEAIMTSHASTSTSRRTATPGGTSMGSPTAAPEPSR